MRKNHDEKEKPIEDLQRDWNNLEKLSITEPSFFFMKEQLQRYQLNKKKAFYKELKLFLITAVVLLSCLSTIAFLTPSTIVTMEIVSIIVAPIIYFILVRKQERKVFNDRN